MTSSETAGSESAQVVRKYIQAWRDKDFVTMRAEVADDLAFVGPIDTFTDADAHQAALKGLSHIVDDIVIQRIWTDGLDVLVWYDLHTSVVVAPVAEWYHVEDGAITAIKVVFDARPFAPLQPAD